MNRKKALVKKTPKDYKLLWMAIYRNSLFV